MKFLKAHSFGNDFIILNDPTLTTKKNLGELAKKLCHRHTGIGADGILVALPSRKADSKMRIINSDGSEADMCGNGIRCFAKYIFEQGISKKKKLAIETLAGIIKPELTVRGNRVSSIKVDMGKPILKTNNINRPIKVSGKNYRITNMIMGATHTVIFVATLDKREIIKLGPIIENHKLFPQKTNVDFVNIINSSQIRLVTWERGIGLSMACGTGACAAAVASCINGKTGKEVTVQLGMGDLFIEWDKNNNVYMTGPAPTNICTGKILL
jgi:diaminopimelate epimerase